MQWKEDMLLTLLHGTGATGDIPELDHGQVFAIQLESMEQEYGEIHYVNLTAGHHQVVN